MTFISPLAEIPQQFKVMTITSSLPLLSLFSSTPPPLLPLPDSLTRPLCLFILPSFSFFFPTLLPLPSLFSLCYTVERWKSFLYPTHHSPVTINSIYVCLNRRVCEEHGHRPRACTHLSARTHAYERARISHPPTHTHTNRHTSDLIHLLHNIIRISSSEMTHTARDRD